MKKERGLALAACAALAALMLLFASQCSPLYPINLWDDANCLLTVGRVMRRGGVLYRDIYEQKGPLLYLIHALAACISDTSFGACTHWKSGADGGAVRSLPPSAAEDRRGLRARRGGGLGRADGDRRRVYAQGQRGGILSAAADGGAGAGLCRIRQARQTDARKAAAALRRAGRGYRDDQIYAAWRDGRAVRRRGRALALKEGGVPRALKSAGVFLAGMAIPILPWVIYFAANGALRDAYTAYIYNNVFLYGGEAASVGAEAGRAGALRSKKNALWAVPAALGLAALAADRGETAAVRLCVAAMAAGQFAAVFFVGRVWAYSLLALAAFGVIGCMQLHRALKKIGCPRGKKGADGGGLRGKPAAGVVRHTERISARAEARAARAGAAGRGHAGGRDAAAIQPPRRRLYLAAHTLPREKYFVLLNVQLEAMRDALDRAVREAVPDYVLVSWRELPAEFDRYELIASDVGYDDDNRLNKTLYLYRRKSE